MNSELPRLISISRRGFLAASIAVLGSHALDGLEVHTSPVKNTAFPRGKARYLLANQCSPEALKASLIPLEKYRPFPKGGDPAWRDLRQETRDAFVAEGVRYLNQSYDELTATMFLSYVRVVVK